MADDLSPAPPRRASTEEVSGAPRHTPPERPTLASSNQPPVLVKQTAPFPVRLCQLLWALSFAVGGAAIVYFFIIRQDQLPLIADTIRAVNAERVEETYTRAADIVFWSIFAAMVSLLLVQITLLVSFMNRRPGVRWWQLTTLMGQALIFALADRLVTSGDKGESLHQLLAAQCVLVLSALLVSNLPVAIAWTARRHDVRRGVAGSGAGDM